MRTAVFYTAVTNVVNSYIYVRNSNLTGDHENSSSGNLSVALFQSEPDGNSHPLACITFEFLIMNELRHWNMTFSLRF
jgi:hypothetical protein